MEIKSGVEIESEDLLSFFRSRREEGIRDAVMLHQDSGLLITCKDSQVRGLSLPGGMSADKIKSLVSKRGMPWRDEYASRVIPYWGSDERVDGMGDIVRQDWIFETFEKNSPMPFSHSWNQPPVGRIIGWEVVKRRPKEEEEKDGYKGPALFLAGLFATKEDSALADSIFRLAKARILVGGSVGFHSRKTINIQDSKERAALGLGKWGLVFEQNELIEFSPTTIPANPGAISPFTLEQEAKNLLPVDLETLALLGKDLPKRDSLLDLLESFGKEVWKDHDWTTLRPKTIIRFDPDQPRDEDGRFGEGGGGGGDGDDEDEFIQGDTTAETISMTSDRVEKLAGKAEKSLSDLNSAIKSKDTNAALKSAEIASDKLIAIEDDLTGIVDEAESLFHKNDPPMKVMFKARKEVRGAVSSLERAIDSETSMSAYKSASERAGKAVKSAVKASKQMAKAAKNAKSLTMEELRSKTIIRYDPDQPRDESGRFGEGGGGGESPGSTGNPTKENLTTANTHVDQTMNVSKEVLNTVDRSFASTGKTRARLAIQAADSYDRLASSLQKSRASAGEALGKNNPVVQAPTQGTLDEGFDRADSLRRVAKNENPDSNEFESRLQRYKTWNQDVNTKLKALSVALKSTKPKKSLTMEELMTKMIKQDPPPAAPPPPPPAPPEEAPKADPLKLLQETHAAMMATAQQVGEILSMVQALSQEEEPNGESPEIPEEEETEKTLVTELGKLHRALESKAS